MMKEFYEKLVDLYAGGELPSEMEEEMRLAAFKDKDLSHDMTSLRSTVGLLRGLPEPQFTEESYQRILMKLYARAGDVQPQLPTPTHLQLHLPISG